MRAPGGLVDIHCHLLPGIDDGPRDEERAVRMARDMVAAGIGTACATPHHSARYPNRAPLVRRTAARLRARLAHEGIPLQLFAGAEIAASQLGALTDRDLRSLALGGGSFVLVEPSPRGRLTLLPIAGRLLRLRLTPVIAHPERTEVFQADPGGVVALLVAGCRLQVTAGSLLGTHGPRAQAAAEEICRIDPAVILATDAHASRRRAPDVIAPALERLAELQGTDIRHARRHARELPMALLAPATPERR